MSVRFAIGDRVRIASRIECRHHRVPGYAKGQVGTVEWVCGAFGQPELLSEAHDGMPFQRIYRVRLPQTALWPDYGGPAHDCLEIEIFEHWLEPAA